MIGEKHELKVEGDTSTPRGITFLYAYGALFSFAI